MYVFSGHICVLRPQIECLFVCVLILSIIGPDGFCIVVIVISALGNLEKDRRHGEKNVEREGVSEEQ